MVDVTPGSKERATLKQRRARLRLTAIVAAGVLLAGVLSWFCYFWLWRTMGSGPAGAPVARQPFEEVWSQRPVVLLGLGDSVTAGFGASAWKSYFQRLAHNPQDEFPDLRGCSLSAVFPKLQSRNEAISGSTSPQHLKRIRRLPVFPRDTLGLVVMTTGGNDIIHNYGRSAPEEAAMYGATLTQARPWIENYERRLEEMLTELRHRFPGGMHLFLANIYDPTDEDGTAGVVGLPSWPDGLRIHAAYNAVIERVAQRHPDVTLVDIRTPMLGHGIYCRQYWRRHYQPHDATYWYDPNFEDPNDRGYDAIRRAFLNAILAKRQAFQAQAYRRQALSVKP